MIDAKMIRANPEQVEARLNKRNLRGVLDEYLQLDGRRRQILVQVEELKNFRNTSSQEVGKLKKAGQDPTELMEKVRQVGKEIAALDEEVKNVEAQMDSILLNIPNLPHESVPVGPDENSNVEIRRWVPAHLIFEPQAHWDIGRLWIFLILSGLLNYREHILQFTKD